MNIGFDAKRLYNNFTGLGNYSRFIVDALMDSFPDEKYYLFTPKVKRNEDTKRFTDSKKITTITPSPLLSKTGLGSLWRTFGLKSPISKWKVDVYHGLSHELPYFLPKHVASAVTVHDLIFLRFPALYKPADRAIYKAKMKHACNIADAIVCISQQTADDLVEFFSFDKSKLKIIAQGCHENFRRKISQVEVVEVKKKYNLPDHFLLNVGTIETRKNVLLILKALKILKNKIDIPLVIIGRPTPYLDEIKKFAAENGLEKNIIYLHKVSFGDFPAIYKLANIFVYPSFYEGFGIPLLEAISCETPVITSTGSCFSETAGPASIYVDPYNADELAFQIESVLQSASLREQMTKESMLYISRFEPQVIANQMMRIYAEIRK